VTALTANIRLGLMYFTRVPQSSTFYKLIMILPKSFISLVPVGWLLGGRCLMPTLLGSQWSLYLKP